MELTLAVTEVGGLGTTAVKGFVTTLTGDRRVMVELSPSWPY